MDLLPICTAQEMQEIDRKSINGDIDRGFEFMQQASRSLLDLVIHDSKNFESVSYFILAGKGNNGGDGILLASYLLDQGYTVFAFIFSHSQDLKGEAALAYEELRNRDPQNTHHRFISTEADLQHCTQLLDQNQNINYIIDAILGVGAKGAPSGFLANAINEINLSIQRNRERTRIIAVDAPSGVDSTNAEVFSPAIQADMTITLGFPKLGCYFYPAKAYFSSTLIQGLDYDPQIVRSTLKENLFFPTQTLFKKSLPRRAVNGSKFDHGVVINCSGSLEMTGAAVFSSCAAYKSGAGLVKVLTETEAAKIIATRLPEAIYNTYASEKESLAQAKDLLQTKYHALSIGPGLGTKQKPLIEYLVQHSQAPVILDADGLNVFAGNANKLKQHQAELLLTPHRGEYLRLFPEDFSDASKPLEVIHALKKRAQELNAIILLKGNPTIIADPKGHVFISPFGNSALATAGSGDVLTGLIAGLVAQIGLRIQNHNADISPLTQAAILGAYMHARAGELAGLEYTEYSTTATDIANFIPKVFKELLTL